MSSTSRHIDKKKSGTIKSATRKNEKRMENEKTNSITLSPEEYLEELEKKVTVTYPKKIECLMSLRDAIKTPDVSECFDEEDITWIDEELKKLAKELECFRKEWRHKNHLYNDTLIEMEKMLETRERVLNDEDGETQLFSQQPQITYCFATKQAELVNEMEKLKKQMYESWYSKH